MRTVCFSNFEHVFLNRENYLLGTSQATDLCTGDPGVSRLTFTRAVLPADDGSLGGALTHLVTELTCSHKTKMKIIFYQFELLCNHFCSLDI